MNLGSKMLSSRAPALAFAAVLTACATVPNVPESPGKPTVAAATAAKPLATGAPTPAAAAATAPAATTPAATTTPARPGDPPPLRPFAEVIKDAKETKGLYTLWQKDEKVWIEIRPEQLDQPFLLTTVLARGIAAGRFIPGLNGDENVASFKRIGNLVQLIARNTLIRAADKSPLARAVRDSTSDSLLGSVAVASAPHPERKSFLIDANALLLTDIAGLGTALDAAFRTGYALDTRNSSIERVAASAEQTSIAVNLHFAVAKLPAPAATAPAPGATVPTPPTSLADARSFFLGLQYRLAALPAPPMPVRLADERVGYFVTEYQDLGAPKEGEIRTRVIDRWRIEKKDPNADVSDPVQPIVAYMDRNIPLELRPSVEAGLLEWNKAFEQAGFRNAIVVKQQPDDVEWDTIEGRHVAVKWFVDANVNASTAIGPRQTDPRTGEILYGAVLIPESRARFVGREFVETITPGAGTAASLDDLLARDICMDATLSLEQAAFAFDLLVERGEFERDSPRAREFVQASIKRVVMHEMGHVLGLRHNFRGSAAVKLEQLRDSAFTRANGLSASIMDYLGANVPLENERGGDLVMSSIGHYDKWAIEWGYRPLATHEEKDALARIAARSATDPWLAYGTDEDAGGDAFFPLAAGIDPLVNRFDYGSNPLAYFERQFKLARELWRRTQARRLQPEEDFRLNRRNLQRGLTMFRFSAPGIAKYVGGVYVNRDRAGSRRALFNPVEPDKQRQALRVVAREILSSESFRFDPDFMRRLGVDQFSRNSLATLSPDFSLPTAVLDIQRAVLEQLMSESVAQRLANAESKVASPRELLSFAEVQATMTDAVWSELANGRDIGSLRRNLQREHLRRLAGALLRPSSTVAADVRSVQRLEAEKLVVQLRRAVANKGARGAMAQAHLAESLTTLREALAAPLYKQGV